MDSSGADVLSPSLALSSTASVLVLAGCGAAETSDADDVAAAASRTVAAGSSRLDAVAESESERTHLQGVVDFAARRASLTGETHPKSEGKPEIGDFRIVGETAYLDAEGMGLRRLDESKRWVAVDMEHSGASLDSLILPFPFIDPARTLELLLNVSEEIEQVGEEDVRGVPTEQYRLTIDLARVVEEAPARFRADLRDELEHAKEKTRRLDLWLDDEGLVRRVKVADPDETLTLDFYDFGVDVDVEAPPADQVAKMPELVPGGSLEYGTPDDEEE